MLFDKYQLKMINVCLLKICAYFFGNKSMSVFRNLSTAEHQLYITKLLGIYIL